MIRLIAAVFACISIPVVLWADCAPDYRSNKNSGLFIEDFVINGTTSMGSDELAAIRSKLTGACVDEDSEEMEERVRALFEDQGYFAATVKNLDVTTTDPLALPKHATLEADLVEGSRYKLAELRFVGNHAISVAQLSTAFTIKRGDLFKRDKISGGLRAIRRLYSPLGFSDVVFVPGTESLWNATIVLTVSIIEGRQYHMGKLKIAAKKGVADRLQGAWQLREGAVFDLNYPEKYINENRSLLPLGFACNNMRLVRNCQDASIEVWLIVDQTDPILQSIPAEVKCEADHGSSE